MEVASLFAPPGARTDEFVVYAHARRYGRPKGGDPSEAESLSFALKPEPDAPYLYWFTVYGGGRTTAQHRRNGYMVEGGIPAWHTDTQQNKNGWNVTVHVPLADMGVQPAAGQSWRLNVQRSALLPERRDRLRATGICHTPDVNVIEPRWSRAFEWAVWSVSYTRIDREDRFGTITLEG